MQEGEIIHHRVRNGEAADPVFLPVGIDAILHAHATVILTEGGGRETDEAHAAVSRGRTEPDHIQEGATADGEDVGVAVHFLFLDGVPDAAQDFLVALALLRPGSNAGGHVVQPWGAGEVFLDLLLQLGEGLGYGILQEDQHLRMAVALQQGSQHAVTRRKGVSGEADAVFKIESDVVVVSGHSVCLRTGSAVNELIPPFLTLNLRHTFFSIYDRTIFIHPF